jgi:hypothetical protein
MPLNGLMLLNTDVLAKVRGVTWSIDRYEMQSTLKQVAQNGRPIRIANYTQPLWKFVYRWGYVKDGFGANLPGNADTDLRVLWGQLLPLHGMAVDFLYQPTDSLVTNQNLTVDVNGNAEIVHNIAGYLESVQYLTNLVVLFNGIPQISPSVAAPSTVPPYLGYVIQGISPGTIVTVSFSYFYRCMLSVDTRQFEFFMQGLAKFPSNLEFEQVRV